MSRPLRVAHVVATSGATGVEAHLLGLLQSFDPSEVAPVLFSPGPGPVLDLVEKAGVRVEHLAPRRQFAFAEARVLTSRWRRQFDIVHAHGPRAVFWAMRAARSAQVPVTVATLHEAGWLTRRGGWRNTLHLWLEERALAGCTRLIAVSECMRLLWATRRPDWASRIDVVHGSSPALLRGDALPRMRPFAGNSRSCRLITVGRLSWAKGTDRLLDALARVLGAGTEATLTVVGDGPDADELRARAGRLGITDRVHWVPTCADVPAAIAEHDAFVTASRHESFGMAVLEAMAVGSPVIATAVGGLVELIRPEATGLLVSGADDASVVEGLDQAIRRLIDTPGLAERLGVSAAQVARRDFAPEAMARATASVYRTAARSVA